MYKLLASTSKAGDWDEEAIQCVMTSDIWNVLKSEEAILSFLQPVRVRSYGSKEK